MMLTPVTYNGLTLGQLHIDWIWLVFVWGGFETLPYEGRLLSADGSRCNCYGLTFDALTRRTVPLYWSTWKQRFTRCLWRCNHVSTDGGHCRARENRLLWAIQPSVTDRRFFIWVV